MFTIGGSSDDLGALPVVLFLKSSEGGDEGIRSLGIR